MLPPPELDANHHNNTNNNNNVGHSFSHTTKQRKIVCASRPTPNDQHQTLSHENNNTTSHFQQPNLSSRRRWIVARRADDSLLAQLRTVRFNNSCAFTAMLALLLCIMASYFPLQQAHARRVTSVYDALIYLNNFGYLPSGQQAGLGYQVTRYEFSKALRRFQKMSNIKASGHLDGETLKMMNVRRCANKDYERNNEVNTQSAYSPPATSSSEAGGIKKKLSFGVHESGPAKAIPAHYTARDIFYNSSPPSASLLLTNSRLQLRNGGKFRHHLRPAFYSLHDRHRRYAATRGWDKTSISWSVRELPPDNSATAMTSSQIMGVIRSAFQLWSDGSSNILKFIEVPSDSPEPADIDIRFTSGVLPNGLIFDGPDGLASYSFYPTNPDFPGDIYFDAAEKWALRDEGINLKQVATQEIGHALGLAHSDDPNAVMWPFYVGYDENFRLGQDDIKGIKTLYSASLSGGASSSSNNNSPDQNHVDTTSNARPEPPLPDAKQTPPSIAPPRVPPPPPPSTPSQRPPALPPSVIVNNNMPHNQPITGVNSAITGAEGPTVLGPTPDRGVGDRCEPGFVPDSITQIQDGRIFFTKNDNYWELRYDPEFGITVPSDYPRSLRNDWKLPDDAIPVDAMFTGLRGRTFVFKGNRYWRYTNLDLDPGYPRLVSVGFPGVPGNIEAAFVWPNDNRTYFVQGENLYNYDRRRFPPLKPAKPLLVDNRQAKIDAAFYWRENRRTLVISGTQLVGLSNNDFKVADAFNFPATFLYACAEMANLYYGRPPNMINFKKQHQQKTAPRSSSALSAQSSSAAYQTKVDFFRALNNSRLGLMS